MKTLVTLLHMSLLDINNSNVSAILSVSSWSVSHISIFFFLSSVWCASWWRKSSESSWWAKHLTVSHLTLAECGGQLGFDFSRSHRWLCGNCVDGQCAFGVGYGVESYNCVLESATQNIQHGHMCIFLSTAPIQGPWFKHCYETMLTCNWNCNSVFSCS